MFFHRNDQGGLCINSYQRMTGILVPRNSLENQLHFFSLVLEKSFSISHFHLETRDLLKNILVLVSENEIFIQIAQKREIHIILRFFSVEVNSFFLKLIVNRQDIDVILEHSRDFVSISVLVLVSKPEIEKGNSHSQLEARD